MKKLALLLLALPSLASAQSISGPAIAVDGDTLEMTGLRIRLFAIDAPELAQTCKRSGENWACGEDAKQALARMVRGRDLRCEQRAVDSYGRSVSTCWADGRNLNQMLVIGGLATAYTEFSAEFAEDEANARAAQRGIWASEFMKPQDYRRANPKLYPPPSPARAVSARPAQLARPQPSGVYFRSCAEARAAGYAPLYRGQPGYRPQMDGDNDGVACEPYRR